MSLLNSIVTSRISRGQRQWLNLVACGHCDPVRSCGNPPRGSDDAADGWLADAVKTRHLRRRLSSRKDVLDDIASLGAIGRASCRERGGKYVALSVVAVVLQKNRSEIQTKI